jgi:hypothetical protein
VTGLVNGMEIVKNARVIIGNVEIRLVVVNNFL